MSHHQRFARAPIASHSRNKILAKRVAWQFISLLGNLLILLIKILSALIVFLARGFGIAVKFIAIKIIGVPLYRLFKKIINILSICRDYLKREWGENFNRNFVIYGGLAFLCFFVAASNLKARTLRPEDIGRSSALYNLLGQDSESNFTVEESTTEETLATTRSNANRGLENIGVASELTTPGNVGNDDNFSAISQSGDALMKPDMTGTETETPARESIIAYTVQEGDTISEIADNFNISVNTILWENKLGERDFIKPGQQLMILPVTGLSHTVARNETLQSIAKKYSAKVEDILEMNKLVDSSTLAIGTKIIIPDGIPQFERPIPTPSTASGLASLRSIFKPVAFRSGRFLWPTPSRRITQYFRGWRHTGLDIGAPMGQPIYAANDGVVVTAGWNRGGYGLYIIIEHPNGLQTLYGHNSKIFVKRGDTVKRGEVISALGSTGRSTGPHLHFEVRSGGNRLNPLSYL